MTCFHQVADGNDASQLAITDDRQMPDAFFRHEAQAIFHRFARVRRGQLRRHDFRTKLLREVLPLQHDFARVVALRDDPDQSAIFHDKQRADIFLGHEA